MSQKFADLTADANELRKLLEEATRSRVKDALTVELRKVETLLIKARDEAVASEALASESKKVSAAAATGYTVRLKDYAWDQSDKFVKIYLTLNGVHKLDEKQLALKCEPNRFEVNVSDLEGKNYVMSIESLLEDIDVEKSYVKQKTDMVLIMLKKKKEGGFKWQCMTKTEKQLKAMRDNKEKPDKEEDKMDPNSDPSAGLMSLMKKMYQDGDETMKREIAKAWTQANDKKTMGAGFGDDFPV